MIDPPRGITPPPPPYTPPPAYREPLRINPPPYQPTVLSPIPMRIIAAPQNGLPRPLTPYPGRPVQSPLTRSIVV